jgi:hypothetical protein
MDAAIFAVQERYKFTCTLKMEVAGFLQFSCDKYTYFSSLAYFRLLS